MTATDDGSDVARSQCCNDAANTAEGYFDCLGYLKTHYALYLELITPEFFYDEIAADTKRAAEIADFWGCGTVVSEGERLFPKRVWDTVYSE